MANVGIVMLAAGNSSRMGRPKQLLDFGGMPLIRHTAAAAVASGCSPVLVVAGDAAEEIRDALEGLPVTVVPNVDWPGGMGTSIRAGIDALAAYPVDAVILTLGDQPMLTPAIYAERVDAHRRTGKPIVTSEYAGTVGVPVLFSSEYFASLQALAPGQGCKGVILANAEHALRIPCPEAEADIDTPEDYARVLRLLTAHE